MPWPLARFRRRRARDRAIGCLGRRRDVLDAMQAIAVPLVRWPKERERNGHAAPRKIQYLGLGNALWDCGRNMRAEYAADLTNRYAQFAKCANGPMRKIADGPSAPHYEWTGAMMRIAGKKIAGPALHYYTRPRDLPVVSGVRGFGT